MHLAKESAVNHHAKIIGPVAAGLLAGTGVATTANAGDIIPQTPTDAAYRVVAYTGQAAPGGGVWTVLGAPNISNTGRVAFVGEVLGLFAQSGIWSEGHTGVGNLQPVVREFLTVPSLAPLTYGEFDQSYHTPVMNESGDIVFGAPLVGDSLTDDTPTGVLRMVNGQLEPIALPFEPAPGGGLFKSISNLPSMNNLGQAVFYASLIGSGVTPDKDSGLYRAAPGAFELIFREGDPIALLPNSVMGSTTSGLPRINDQGVVGVENFYNANGQPTWAMWRAEPGGMSFLDLVARAGDASPAGPPYGGSVFNFGEISINNAGEALFVQTAAFGLPSNRGVWLDQNGVESAIAHWGMAGPLGLTFRVPDSSWNMVNGDGRVLFQSTFDAPGFPDASGGLFYRDGAGPANIVAIANQDAPGMLAGVAFTGIFGARAINNHGRIAYTARMSGPGITNDNDFAIWMTREGAGDADLILYEGQVMSVGGQLRTVEFFTFRAGSGPESGRRGAFNDNNQVGLLVHFTDDSAAVIVATVPSLCPGDFNDDGVINGADLATLLGAWGACQDEFCAADLNFDGIVNGADMALMLGAWGSCP